MPEHHAPGKDCVRMIQARPKPKLSQSYNPTTFLERGALVPFTTPMLSGTRARPGERRGIELIIPNPSGGPGAYILAWDSARELCRPTVHDTKLQERVADLPSISPSSIRHAARAIAAQGFAGREARAAAENAAKTEKQDHVLVNFLLVMALVKQFEPARGDGAPPERDRLDEMEDRARRAISAVAPRIGRTPEAIAERLEQLAVAFEGVGTGLYAAQSRLARSLEALTRFHADMTAWRDAHLDESGEQAGLAASVAELTIDWARRTLSEAAALTENVAQLLRRWENEPEAIGRLAGRPDWLLDGWEQIRLLWDSASGPEERRAVLHELMPLIPVIPREAADWVGIGLEKDHPGRGRRFVGQNEDWRTGHQVLDVIARNEHLRAVAA